MTVPKKLLELFQKKLGDRVWYLDQALTMLISFVIFFTITRYMRMDAPQSLVIGGKPVHHFAWVLVFFLTPAIVLRQYLNGLISVYLFNWFFGFCFGAIYDEFIMLFHLTDDDGHSMKGFWIMVGFLILIFIFRVLHRKLKKTIDLGNPWVGGF